MIRDVVVYSARELTRSLSPMSGVLFACALGLYLVSLVFVLTESSERFIEAKARETLMGDLTVSSLLPLSREKEQQILKTIKPTKTSNLIEFVTMVGAKENTLLAQVSGIEPNFPLRSSLKLDPVDARAKLDQNLGLVVDPDILPQLGVKVGEAIRIGNKELTILGTIKEPPGGPSLRLGLSPQIYLSLSLLKDLGLMDFGSQVNHLKFFNLDIELNSESPLVKELRQDPALVIRTPQDSLRNMSRAIDIFRLFLGLSTLAIVVISFVAGYYYFQVYLSDRAANLALMLLFTGSRTLTQIYVTTLVGLTLFLSLLLALLCLGISFSLALPFLSAHLPQSFEISVSLYTLLQISLMMVALTLAYATPLSLRLRSVSPNHLLERTGSELPLLSWKETLVAYIVPLIAFFVIASLVLSSWQIGLIYVCVLSGIGLIVLTAWPYLFRLWSKRINRVSKVALSLTLERLSNLSFGSALSWVVITLIASLGFLLLNLVSTLKKELSFSGLDRLPRYFVLNIQAEDRTALEAFVSERQCLLKNQSPFILARLEKKNGGTDFSERLKNYPIRLSYRSALADSEEIVKGPPLPRRYDPNQKSPPLVSVEKEYAERNNFNLGDTLDFDVQGVPISAVVYNFRKVEWTSFQPNFFIQFQAGVLEDAPQTYIANIYATEKNPNCDIPYELVRAFPGLSLIDVRLAASRLMEITEAFLVPLRWIGGLCVAAALSFLVAVLLHSLRRRKAEFRLLQILGASENRLKTLIFFELGLVSLTATLTGFLLGSGLLIFISRKYFDVLPHFNLLDSVLFAIVIVMAPTLLAKKRAEA